LRIDRNELTSKFRIFLPALPSCVLSKAQRKPEKETAHFGRQARYEMGYEFMMAKKIL
jgi:hypothetical protein